MNKIISKAIFIRNKIKTPKYSLIEKTNFKIKNIKKIIKKKNISFPVVIKPINEGSSLGVKVCNNREKLLKVPNLGTFKIREKGTRIGRNPKTGEESVISARSVVSFNASEKLKSRLNLK